MNARAAIVFQIMASACGLMATTGCSLLRAPKADPTRFYVLTTRAAGVVPSAGAPALLLRPVEVAGYLRNRPVIVRQGDNEIAFRDYARWGEPLEQGIGRVLREELRAKGVVVSGGAGREGPAADHQLTVRVLGCEGAAGGAVVFRATWELARMGEKPVVTAGGEFRADGLNWDGKTEAMLVARLSEAVTGLAADIATAVANR